MCTTASDLAILTTVSEFSAILLDQVPYHIIFNNYPAKSRGISPDT